MGVGGESTMNYLFLICSDGVPSAEKTAAMRAHVPGWVQEMNARGVRSFGYALQEPGTAVTVRSRAGQTLLSDGPFAETKEFIGGLDLISCSDLDEAIQIAARHPVSWYHRIEIRPFDDGPRRSAGDAVMAPVAEARPETIDAERFDAASGRYVLFMCLDGIPGSDEQEASIRRDGADWLAQARESGAHVFGHALKHADTATTVRVRNGETLLTDGPFAETKEFVGGFDILTGVSRSDAVELAARHPLARFHMVEVRPFAEDETGDD